MTKAIVCAIFPSDEAADRALRQLDRSGVPDRAVSVLAEDRARGEVSEDAPHADDKSSGALKGLGIGAGVGALFGLSALVIPGVGPFIAAGSLVESLGVVGSAAASGAVVGGAAGSLTGALVRYGLSEEDARYYDRRIREGGVLIAVDTRHAVQTPETIADLLHSAGGTSTSRSIVADPA